MHTPVLSHCVCVPPFPASLAHRRPMCIFHPPLEGPSTTRSLACDETTRNRQVIATSVYSRWSKTCHTRAEAG